MSTLFMCVVVRGDAEEIEEIFGDDLYRVASANSHDDPDVKCAFLSVLNEDGIAELSEDETLVMADYYDGVYYNVGTIWRGGEPWLQFAQGEGFEEPHPRRRESGTNPQTGARLPERWLPERRIVPGESEKSPIDLALEEAGFFGVTEASIWEAMN